MKRLLFISCFLFSYCTFASNQNLNLDQKSEKSASKTVLSTEKNQKDNRSWYVSWGYNKDYWSNSDIRISQPSLGNAFTVHNVTAGDCPGWNTGIFNKSLMGPQYNIRIGHYLNPKHTWGVELSFDHTKYNTNLYQVAHITGKINNQIVDENQMLTPQYFYYALHNGANLLMVNLVRRQPFLNMFRTNLQFAVLGKFGGGVVLPHPENTIMGNTVDVGPKSFSNAFGIHHGWWQFGGWTTGVELGLQMLVHHRVYVELTDKEAYLTLSNIQVFDGTASQSMWLNEVIANLGVQF